MERIILAEREGGRCIGTVLAHTEYPASNPLHCTVHSLRSLSSITHYCADTNTPLPCRISARRGHQPAQDQEPGMPHPSIHRFILASVHLCLKKTTRHLVIFFFFFLFWVVALVIQHFALCRIFLLSACTKIILLLCTAPRETPQKR